MKIDPHPGNESGERRVEELRKELDASMQAREKGVQLLKEQAERISALTPQNGIKLKLPLLAPEEDEAGPTDSDVKRMPPEEAVVARRAQLVRSSESSKRDMATLRATVSQAVHRSRSTG